MMEEQIFCQFQIKRPQVNDLLIQAVKRPLTTVIAGVGYGKTQAVRAGIESMGCKSIWLQLSQLDNYTERFWERFADSFDAHSHNLRDKIFALGFPESNEVFDKFLRLLTEGFEPNDHIVLVFDDFYFITNKEMLNFIELLIVARKRNVSVVIISRVKPDLSLSAFLSKGLLARITEKDLRFSRKEMDAYFQKMGLEYGELLLAKVYSYTDGWIAAICFVGLALKEEGGGPNPHLAAEADIFSLIEKEVFLPVSSEVKDILIQIAPLDVIPSGFLQELVDQDIDLISQLSMISFFIYDAPSQSYRLHHLFREFLLKRKAPPKREGQISIHYAVAQWYEKNNNTFEAAVHYKKCDQYEKIFDIILSITHYVPKKAADFYADLIEQAPKELTRARPFIRLAKVRNRFNNNEITSAQEELNDMRKEFEALPVTEENKAVLGEIYLLLALIGVINVDYEFEELFKKADEYLPNGSQLFNSQFGIAEGINVCSIHNPAAGELKRHETALFNAAPYASRVMNGCGYGMEYLNAAESAFYIGDTKNAEKYAYTAIYMSQQYQQYDIESMGNFVLVRVFLAKGDYSKISEILNLMQKKMERSHNQYWLSLYDIISGWFYLKVGRPDRIPQWIKEGMEQRNLAPVVLGREFLVRSDCLLFEKKYYELLAFMEHTDHLYESRGILFARIQNAITRAMIYHAMDEFEESIKSLRKAYELSHPNNLIMTFIEYGNKMRTLMMAVKRNNLCNLPIDWIDKLQTKASTYAKQLVRVTDDFNSAHTNINKAGGELKNLLSEREMEVLTYLCRGLTREEIAASCYLSHGTINGVLRKIYDKIGAANAADAVRIATEKYSL